jgi:two-component system phosphate regulon response regulator PhoB
VIIEDGPLMESLVTLLERPEEEMPQRKAGDRVCEAHILAPNLILLDLTRACADQNESWRPHRNGKNDTESQILKLALAKPHFSSRGRDMAPLAEPLPASEFVEDSEHESLEPPVEQPPVDDFDPILQIGPVRIDRHGHWAYLNDKKLHLTPTEFRLLECFLREPGRAFTRSQLLDASIGNGSYVLERTIDVHIRSLRTKLGPARDFVETVRGVGYRFRETPE